jgi:hypothetical protein
MAQPKWAWLEALIAGNGPIRRLIPVDVRGKIVLTFD